MTGLWALLGAGCLAGLLGWWSRASSGRVRIRPTRRARETTLPEPIRRALEPDAAVNLVQLSTMFCAPCRQTGRLLAGLAAEIDGVAHTELDVTNQPAVASQLGILRTPTTLALSPEGTELLRVGGVPRRAELLAALQPYLP